MKIFPAIFLLLIATSSFGQDNSLLPTIKIDSPSRRDARPPLGATIFIFEAYVFGTSYYAAKPKAHGDRVMGWLYLVGSAGMLVFTPAYFFDKKNKEDRIGNAVTMLGLSYGFYRIANYNLWRSNGDDFATRFKRNILESHIAYIVPVALGVLTETILDKRKKKKTSRVETSFQFSPSSVYLSIRF